MHFYDILSLSWRGGGGDAAAALADTAFYIIYTLCLKKNRTTTINTT